MTSRAGRRRMSKASCRPGWLPNKAWRDERVSAEKFPLPPMWIDVVRFERASFAWIAPQSCTEWSRGFQRSWLRAGRRCDCVGRGALWVVGVREESEWARELRRFRSRWRRRPVVAGRVVRQGGDRNGDHPNDGESGALPRRGI
jgi:hypothetical protein